jgi:hypothetical protein
MSSHLGDGVIQPVVLAQLTLKSGVVYVWSGVGDLVWNGNTYTGVGYLGKVGEITEASAVQAEGTTLTLSGIGLSSIDIPTGPTPPDPPFAPPAGQSVAWAYATFPNSYFPTEILVPAGTGIADSFGGSLTLDYSASFETGLVLTWTNFKSPPEIPLGATITGVYPTIGASRFTPHGFAYLRDNLADLLISTTAFSGVYYGTRQAGLYEVTLGAAMENSVFYRPPDPPLNDLMHITFVGAAVYYEGTPLSKTPLIYEAMNDVRIGGPAKIWYGLWSNGAFIGTPYLAFSGTVDKPTVNTGTTSSSITLALENRLINLQRANERRYTAADQHLAYPDDLAFNWVELLNDMSLKEGVA